MLYSRKFADCLLRRDFSRLQLVRDSVRVRALKAFASLSRISGSSTQPEIDFIHERISTTVFMRNYFIGISDLDSKNPKSNGRNTRKNQLKLKFYCLLLLYLSLDDFYLLFCCFRRSSTSFAAIFLVSSARLLAIGFSMSNWYILARPTFRVCFIMPRSSKYGNLRSTVRKLTPEFSAMSDME